MDIRLRFGERSSLSSDGEGDCGTRDESNSMGSGRSSRAVGDADGEPSSWEMGELSSMISWVERVLGARDLMARAGVAKEGPGWVEDGRGVAENRGVAWNWFGPRTYCAFGVWLWGFWVLDLFEIKNREGAGVWLER
jgi:hypothetical protein